VSGPSIRLVVPYFGERPPYLALVVRSMAANPEVASGTSIQVSCSRSSSRTSGGQTAARACARVGFVPRVAFESDDYTAIRELVGTGAGIALLPDLAKFPPHESVVLRSLGADRPVRNIQVATRPEAFRSPAASAMLEILCEQRPAPQVAAATPPSR